MAVSAATVQRLMVRTGGRATFMSVTPPSPFRELLRAEPSRRYVADCVVRHVVKGLAFFRITTKPLGHPRSVPVARSKMPFVQFLARAKTPGVEGPFRG